MNTRALRVFVLAILAAVTGGVVNIPAFQGPSLAGRWSLNRAQSQFPRDLGFGMDMVAPGASDRSGADAGAASGTMRGNNPRPVSEEQARNEQQLVTEVRNPPAFLAITQTDAAITLTDERGRTRTFHPDGRDEFQQLESGPMATVTRWDGPRLVVRYKVQADRELRYTLSRASETGPLVVQVQFVERGGRDVVTRIYDPARPGDPFPVPAQPASAQPTAAPLSGQGAAQTGAATTGAPPAGAAPPRVYQPGQPFPPAPSGQVPPAAPAGAPGAAPPGMMPASPDRLSATPLTTRPGSELRGLASLGVVVEDLSQAATSCGLRQAVVESTVTKSLTAAGLRVVTNTDEDTYLYVRIVTTAMTTGFCFSRYDAILYTNMMATPTYGSAPALVQVELLRNGGLAGGGAASHADAVMQSLKQYVDSFAARIRDANK
jgi:hypothetical protein